MTRFLYPMSSISLSASIFMTMSVTVERYWAVCRPTVSAVTPWFDSLISWPSRGTCREPNLVSPVFTMYLPLWFIKGTGY